MARRRKKESSSGGAPEWMTTYSDLVTLLLCFFVLLFAFSTTDAQKFQTIMESLQGSLGLLEGGKTINQIPVIPSEGSTEEIPLDLKYEQMAANIEDYIEKNGLEDSIDVLNEKVGIILRFNENILFDSGKADLKAESRTMLIHITELLNSDEVKTRGIRVEGHTDNDPIYSSRYPTNWELSVSRACNVVRFLIEDMEIDSRRLSAAGYSEYHPVEQNDTPGNKAKNRRVDILILK